MLKKFKDRGEARDFRAARAFTFCALEGTEVADAQVDLYRSYTALLSASYDEEAETIVALMERLARDHAREYFEKGPWAWDEPERHNVLLCLRHLRETNEVHPELARAHHL